MWSVHSRGLTCVATLHHSRPCPCTLRLSCLKMLLLLSLKATAAHILSLSLSLSLSLPSLFLSSAHPNTRTHAQKLGCFDSNQSHAHTFKKISPSHSLFHSLTISLSSAHSLSLSQERIRNFFWNVVLSFLLLHHLTLIQSFLRQVFQVKMAFYPNVNTF